MDMQTLLTRMDQLEKLVISQSRELDNLKRIVRSASYYNQHNTTDRIQQQPLNYSNHVLNKQDSRRPNQNPNNTQNLLSPTRFSSPPASTASRPLYQPLMNSNVHPQSAIPPVGIRSSPSITTSTTATTQSSHVPSQVSRKLVENLNGLLCENRPSQATRWSSTVNAIETVHREPSQYLVQIPNGALGEPNKDAFDETGRKHERQNFVESFQNYQSRYRELRTKDDQNCENKSPCDLRQNKNQCHGTRQDTQQVQTNQPTGNVQAVPEKQCATDMTNARLRAKESIYSSNDDLTQYIVGELEIIPEGTLDVKQNSLDEEKHIYITFIAPHNKGPLWRRVRENSFSQSPRKRKHNDQEAHETIATRGEVRVPLISGHPVTPYRRDWTSIYYNISKKYRHQ